MVLYFSVSLSSLNGTETYLTVEPFVGHAQNKNHLNASICVALALVCPYVVFFLLVCLFVFSK